jgi:hypothetical protein
MISDEEIACVLHERLEHTAKLSASTTTSTELLFDQMITRMSGVASNEDRVQMCEQIMDKLHKLMDEWKRPLITKIGKFENHNSPGTHMLPTEVMSKTEINGCSPDHLPVNPVELAIDVDENDDSNNQTETVDASVADDDITMPMLQAQTDADASCDGELVQCDQCDKQFLEDAHMLVHKQQVFTL